MIFQKLAFSNINIIGDFLNKTFQEEPAQDEFDPHCLHDEELKALLVSLVEDIGELVVTVAEEQSKEVVERLEETRDMMMLVVRKAVLVYPTVLAVSLITRPDIVRLCYHWSGSIITSLSLVESFIVRKYFHGVATLALLCHKEATQGTQSPLLKAYLAFHCVFTA